MRTEKLIDRGIEELRLEPIAMLVGKALPIETLLLITIDSIERAATLVDTGMREAVDTPLRGQYVDQLVARHNALHRALVAVLREAREVGAFAETGLTK